ncbi:tRNA (adenosine(37)-N6)-dimethylallyltransferase MiaA [Fulvivirgaceae bacterium BMA12]|uniref:tRNA dimethylallyltransferase n=1 Tax=Agaribacillus aureus TaxID=3051825 RepID=A0ABT8L8Y8_9BACT|nr:tRNA (adenosine(37)-N6)-dimethylallyltransferase MiaA [Fulvivirgaceae bacterium BMA12]
MAIKKTLLVIVGPTAVGKTDFSIALAKRYKTAIVSADSRQFFREMNIGTAKPGASELREVKHYFINNLSIHDTYNIADFEKEAIDLVTRYFLKNDVLILTGGSGLYIKAVCEGIDNIPGVDPGIRIRLNSLLQEKGLDILVEKLKEHDPEYFQKVDLNNPQRVIRALEVCLGTGKPYSGFLKGRKQDRNFQTIKIGLNLSRELLYDRINTRMDQMISDGLFEEAKELYPFKEGNALQTVGYKEIFDYMDGKYDKAEAIRLLKRNSRRYAKRQLTWFTRDPDIKWFSPGEPDKVAAYLSSKMRATASS